jgi:hypothetical protein
MLIYQKVMGIDLHQHGIVNIPAEYAFNGFEVGLVAIRSDLDAIAKARGQVGNKVDCGF